jgi:glyoxylase-like metal-dependent hydrolase (beta-lactamase superfamily II)
MYIKNLHFIESMNKNLLWRNFDVVTLNTPGHTMDSLTIKMFNFIFSGDALIPGVLSSYRNKLDNMELIRSSVFDIYGTFKGKFLLCPGHGEDYEIEESKKVDCFRPVQSGKGFNRIH